MKNILKYIICFILVIFIIPALLTIKNRKDILSTSENIENSEIKLKDYKKIKLLHTKTNEIEEVNLEDYICNVVSAEMPADYEKEALKAQAIVARTYIIYQIEHHKHDNCDICDDSNCCQAWISKEERLKKWGEHAQENWNKIAKSVEETQGVIITYNNQPINAFFHSNSGGTTEIPKDVWGGEGFPYLQTVQTSGEEGYKQFESEVKITYEELLNKLKSKYEDIQIDFSKDDDIKIIEYTGSGRVKTVKFGNHELSGVETRAILGLKSTNFSISKKEKNIIFDVKGNGHGVGMSQTGANTLAKNGKKAEEIIKHFYQNVELYCIN